MKEELKKLGELEKQLTLIRDDFAGYIEFVKRNIRQANQITELERSFEELIESFAGALNIIVGFIILIAFNI